MKKVINSISYLFVSLLSVLGLGVGLADADISNHANVTSIKENTPLYLETSSTMLQQDGQNLYQLADHESHYSHESHDSHYSHDSHSSHYSHYSGY